jgi:hypothetical protein
MSGICAGHPKKTFFGDVIVADRLFKFDEGKIEVIKTPETHEREETLFHDESGS